MVVGRALRVTGAVAGGLAGGLALGVVAVVGSAVVVLWWTARSEGEAERKAVQRAFVDGSGRKTATVSACGPIVGDSSGELYGCRIVTGSCVRTFEFIIGGAEPVSPMDKPNAVLQHPCRFASDPGSDPD